jgi:hypothetical protein
MSRKGTCWDIAVAEAFFSSLKKESIKKQIYKSRDLAKAAITDYIETFYNRSRRHSHLGGVSPEQFEAAHKCRNRVSTESWDLHLHQRGPGRRREEGRAALGHPRSERRRVRRLHDAALAGAVRGGRLPEGVREGREGRRDSAGCRGRGR